MLLQVTSPLRSAKDIIAAAKLYSEKKLDTLFSCYKSPEFIWNYKKKIKCVVQYYPLHRYDFYKKTGFGYAIVPNTDTFYDNMISFPFQHWMSEEEIEYMLKSTIEVLNELSK